MYSDRQCQINSLINKSSRAGEFHPHPLWEPDVNLSIHPALIVQPLFNSFALLIGSSHLWLTNQ